MICHKTRNKRKHSKILLSAECVYYCTFFLLSQYSSSQISTCLIELAFLSRNCCKLVASYGGGIVHGFESLGNFTIESSMNLLSVPFKAHAIVSGQYSTAFGGITGLNLRSFAYSFSR
ncbi:hypothetical protein V8G54_010772 [Vigna mungo]|uniref:Uncharacterized protein n=1 Tax=Vigna mungo TaxID=3915 RepID=A0AAQ3NX66_VIGMU